MATDTGILSAGEASLHRNQMASHFSRDRCCSFSQYKNCSAVQFKSDALRLKSNIMCSQTNFRELIRSRYLCAGLHFSQCVGANRAILAQVVSILRPLHFSRDPFLYLTPTVAILMPLLEEYIQEFG
jgi:hypothetical protein